MKRIRTAILGQGRSGRDIHGLYLNTDKRFQIVAAVDAIKERRQRAADEFGCDVYNHYRSLLQRDDIDLVVNATFSHMHVPVSLEFLKAGYNVLCEKPLASSVKDVDRLIRASRKSGKVFAIFQQSRYAPYFQQVRKVIDSGVLGRIVQVSIAFNGWSRRWDWQTLTSYNGGNLMNTGPHPLDQALVLFGEGKPQVTCFMDRTDGTFGNAENHVKLLLSGRGHPLIDLEVSSCCAYPPFRYNVYGTRGGMKTVGNTAEWKYFKWRESGKRELTRAPLAKDDGTPSYPVDEITWHEKSWPADETDTKSKRGYSAATAASTNMTECFYKMLYKTLSRGAPLEITPQQVRRQIAVIEECHRQNRKIWRRAQPRKKK